MNNLNIDETIDYVKNIVDNIRCTICDKSDGQRLRYSCGHTACIDCVSDIEYCPICLIPSPTSSPRPKPDDALTERVKNALVLLKACEDLFHTDVYTRKRLSEHLKIEKELFPQCIQAEKKYENKRKSTMLSTKKDKSKKSTHYPGEETSSFKENMDSSISYVQQWLNKSNKDFSRKPFADLNVNTKLDDNVRVNKTVKQKSDENVPLQKSSRKRTHFKTTAKTFSPLGINRKLISKSDDSKRIKRELYKFYEDTDYIEKQKKSDKDESGIFMDDPIVIDDSQETVIDKDKNAWLAVLEAHKNEEIESTSEVNLDSKEVESRNSTFKETPINTNVLQCKENQRVRVPFYKKSFITETCIYCDKKASNVAVQPMEVKITIDSDMFSTTIKILKNIEDRLKSKSTNSVSIQTDACEMIQIDDTRVSDSNVIDIKNIAKTDFKGDQQTQISVYIPDTQSKDLFADDLKSVVNENKRNNTNNGVVIAESESDTDLEESGPLPVKVDVHRSCDESEYGILGEIINIQKHDTKTRRGPRGLTPTSTDSSEKENFNPNRTKRTASKKKKYAKK